MPNTPNNQHTAPSETATEPSIAIPAVSVPAPTEFKGIHVVEKKSEDPSQPAGFVIEIHVLDCLKSTLQWWNEYNVGKTLKVWAAQIDWKNQVWKPLKIWSKETDWEKVRREVKEGVDSVNWKEVRQQAKEGLERVDWKQVRKEAHEGLQQVDWKKVCAEVKEGTKVIPWKDIKEEVNEVVDWNAVKKSAKELVDVQNLKQSLTDVCPPELQEEMIGDLDLNDALKKAREKCPEEVGSCEDLLHAAAEMLEEE